MFERGLDAILFYLQIFLSVRLAANLYQGNTMNLGKFLYLNYIKFERRFAGLKAKQVSIDEGNINYLTGGTGPVLILLHGFGANKDHWNKIARYLTRHFRVIVPDIPGFGDSFKDVKLNYQIEDQLTRLHKFVDVMKLKQFSLAGSSYGGYLAANYTSHFPTKINRLSLFNPLGVQSSEQSVVFENIILGGRNILLPNTKQELICLVNKCFVNKPYFPDFVLNHLASEASQQEKLNHKLFYQIHHVSENKMTFEQPIEESLSHYTNPIDLYWGSEDKILHQSGADVLANKLENLEYIKLENMGHLPMLEAPQKIAELFKRQYGLTDVS